MFNKRKLRKEQDKKTKLKMKELFENNIEDFDDNYRLLYGYSMSLNQKTSTYIYTSLVIAYNEFDMKLIILETDKDFKDVTRIIKLKKNSFKKAEYNKSMVRFKIYLSDKKNEIIEFYLIDKNFEDDILSFINQEDDIEDFEDFFNDFKRKNIKK